MRKKNCTSNSQFCGAHCLNAKAVSSTEGRNAIVTLFPYVSEDQNSSRSTDTPPESKIPVPIPKLDLSAIKESKDAKGKANTPSEKQQTKLHAETKSKTQTFLVHKHGSKIPVRTKIESKVDNSEDVKAVADLDKKTETNDAPSVAARSQKLSHLNQKLKGDVKLGIVVQSLELRKTRTALDYEKRVRSSGYGAPGTSNVQPVSSVTPTSSAIRQRRQTSATLSKSLTTDKLNPDESKNSKRDLLAKTNARAGSAKAISTNRNACLETEDQAKRSQSKRGEVTHRTELTKISEIVREESANSEIPNQSELQIRLSAIKRKVEVRKRRGDSRSSFGSDLDTSFQDRSVLTLLYKLI